MSDNTELVVIEEGKALEFFTGGGLEPFLAEVKTMVETFDHDMTTKKGRDKTRSFARKIATFKGKVEDSGKELVADWKKQSKAVDESRKHSRDTLDTLRDKARQPLTEWEQIDKDRIAKHGENLETLRNMVNCEVETAAAYAAKLVEAKACEMGKCWEEFASDAAEAKDEAIAFLEAGITRLTKSEAEAAELDRLRKEAAAREQAERDERIAEGARKEAQAEIDRAEERAAQAERDTIAAQERGKLAAKEAAAKGAADTAARIQREKDEAAEKQAKLEANKRHTNKIKAQAEKSLVAEGLSETDAAIVVMAIAAGSIANISINY